MVPPTQASTITSASVAASSASSRAMPTRRTDSARAPTSAGRWSLGLARPPGRGADVGERLVAGHGPSLEQVAVDAGRDRAQPVGDRRSPLPARVRVGDDVDRPRPAGLNTGDHGYRAGFRPAWNTRTFS